MHVLSCFTFILIFTAQIFVGWLQRSYLPYPCFLLCSPLLRVGLISLLHLVVGRLQSSAFSFTTGHPSDSTSKQTNAHRSSATNSVPVVCPWIRISWLHITLDSNRDIDRPSPCPNVLTVRYAHLVGGIAAQTGSAQKQTPLPQNQ